MKNATIVILAILTIMFGVYGFMQSEEAQRQADLVKQGEQRALLAEDDALRSRDRSEKDRLASVEILQEMRRVEAELNECRKKRSSK